MGGHLMESDETVGFSMLSGALVLVGMVSTVPGSQWGGGLTGQCKGLWELQCSSQLKEL